MTIFWRELKANRRGLIIWTLVLAVFVYWIMSLYPSMAAEGAGFEELLSAFPEGFLKAFGLDRLSLTNIFGFYATEAYFMLILFGSFFAVMLGSGILSKEENEKTIEFLLAKPVTRSQIVRDKVLTYFLYISLFNLVMFFVGFTAFEQFKISDYNLKILVLLHLASYLVHLTFASIGFLLSIFISRKKSIYPVAIGLVLTLYFINMMANLSDSLEFLAYFTPFKYADAVDIILDERIRSVYLIILFAVIMLTVAASFVLYNRKDITV